MSECLKCSPGKLCDACSEAIRLALSAGPHDGAPDGSRPMHFRCPDCGPHIGVDEDGCCHSCGTDTTTEDCTADCPPHPPTAACSLCDATRSVTPIDPVTKATAPQEECPMCRGSGRVPINVDPTTVHMCGPSNSKCKCQCPDGPCEHKWDGPWEEFDGGRGGTSTCSRCGTTSLSHALWCGP